MTDLHAYARGAATRAGIDPDLFERQIQQESGFNPDAYNASSGATGIAQIIARFHPNVDPRDPIASLDYAAHWLASMHASYGSYKHALAAYNWGPGNVNRWNGQRATLPAETRNYLDVILGPGWPEPTERTPTMPSAMTYNPDAPVDIQTDAWSCSEQSAQWLLRSIGRDPKDAWIRGQLLDNGIVTVEQGLMDASGQQLAAWLQREYGDEMGLTFASKNGASWEDLVAIVGRQPVMIGGRTWNHWSGARRLVEGGIELANPAPNWKGVGTVLDREEFERLGGFSFITVTDAAAAIPPVVPPPAPPAGPDPRDARIAQLEQEKAGLVSIIGYLTGDVADAFQAAVNTLRAQKPAA